MATWRTPRHHLFSWVLSFHKAREHYPETTLCTDDFGASLLIEQLGLPFDHCSFGLNRCEDIDPGWWAAGKLAAYAEQTEPFVHIDSDVYLWKRLPERMEQASVFAQNPEWLVANESCYDPASLETALRRSPDWWLPVEWHWYRSQEKQQYAPCCGILGGTDTEFLRKYSETALQILRDTRNAKALEAYTEKISQTILIEQYLLGACIDYSRMAPEFLFDSTSDAMDEHKTNEAGYTHLIAGAKHEPWISHRLELRVRSEYPEYYERCWDVAARLENLAATA